MTRSKCRLCRLCHKRKAMLGRPHGKCRRCYDGPEKYAARQQAAKVRQATGREGVRAKMVRLERENAELRAALATTLQRATQRF